MTATIWVPRNWTEDMLVDAVTLEPIDRRPPKAPTEDDLYSAENLQNVMRAMQDLIAHILRTEPGLMNLFLDGMAGLRKKFFNVGPGSRLSP